MVRLNTPYIARQRKKLGLTKTQAGEAAGFKPPCQRWNDLERGRYPSPRLDTLTAVARVLGCDVRELLED